MEKELELNSPFDCYEVRTEGGINWVYYNGEKLPYVKETTIVQTLEHIGGVPYVEVTFTVFATMPDTEIKTETQ